MEQNNILSFEYIEGLRKGSQLLWVSDEQQLYKFKSNYSHSKRYVCYLKDCPASVIVEINNQNLCRKPNKNIDHNHSNQKDTISKIKLISSIKEGCRNASMKRNNIRDIFNDKCLANKNAAHLVQFGKMRRNLLNIRNLALPKCPTKCEDISKIFESPDIMSKYGMSRYDSNMKFYQNTIIETNFIYTIFMSQSICNAILLMPENSPRQYLLDTTFKIVPVYGFKELLIIYISHTENVYPFLYVLMDKKSEEIYKHIFQYIENNLFKFKPDLFVTDFEKSLRNSLKYVFPQAEFEMYWFHFCQTLTTKALTIKNLKNFIYKDKNVFRLFQKFLLLPLLQPIDIIEAFNILKHEINRNPVFKPRLIFDEFLEYFEYQWMNKETPFNFSVYGENIRITSAVEANNYRLNSKLIKNGNFWKFLDFILEDDHINTIEFQNSVEDVYSIYEPSSKIRKIKWDIIENAIKNLDSNKITIHDFLNQMTNQNIGLSTFFCNNIDDGERESSSNEQTSNGSVLKNLKNEIFI